MFSNLTSTVSGTFSNISGSLSGVFTNLSGKFSGVFTSLSATASSAFKGIGGGFSTLIGGISSGASSVGGAISGMFTSGTSALSTMWDSTKGFFSSSLDGAKSLGSKLVDAFKNPMGVLGGLKDKVSGLFGKAGTTESITEEISLDSAKIDTPDMEASASDKAGGMMEKFNKIDMKQVLKGAAALVVLAGALYIAAKAFQEFSEVEWDGVAKGIIGLTALVVAAKFLEKGSASMLKGAASIAVLGLALVPAALAFQMFGDVNWGGVFIAIGVLTALGIAAALIAGVAPLIIGGAIAIGVLGLALIPFAAAAALAGFAMTLVADAFVTMTSAIKQLEFEDIGKIALLGATFAGLGVMIPFILLGAAAMGVMTLALIPFSLALMTAGMGISMLVAGMDGLGPALKGITGDDSPLNQLIASFAMLGLAMPVVAIGAVALGVMSASLVALGLGATFAAGGMALLTLAMGDIGLGDLIDKMVALGTVGPGLIAAAAGIAAVGASLVAMSVGSAISGIFSFFSGGTDPIEKFVRLGKDAPKLEKAGDALKSFADASSAMSGLDDMLSDVADGLDDIFGVLEDAPSGINETMKAVGEGMKGLLEGFSGANLSADIDYEDALEGIADGIDEIFGVMEDIDVTLAPNLSIVGDGMKSLLPSFAGDIVGNISEDIDGILEAVGKGLEEFFSSMEDIDPVILPILPQIGPGVSELLVALGAGNLAEFDADLEEIFEGLGSGIGKFMGSVGEFDADQITAMSGIGTAISEILTGIGSIGEINFDADDLADIMEDLGPAIDAFLQPLKSVDDDILAASASVGQALGAIFGSLGAVGEAPDLDWEDVLEGFGDGVEELFDELSDLDPSTFGRVILVGDVMAQVFSSIKDIKLDESVGDAIGNMGDGIEDFFDEVEHVDMQTAPQVLEVTRLIGRTISYLPIDKINAIPEDIESKLNNLGDGLEDMLDEMAGMVIPEKEAMVAVASTIREIVPVLSGDAISKIPGDIDSILDNVGEAIYDMFDSIEEVDISTATTMAPAFAGMGTLFKGIAEISDSFVDVSAIRDMGVAFSEIVKTMAGMETGDVDADAMATRFQSLGTGMKNIMESFGEMDLSAFAGIDIGSLLGGIANGIGRMVDLVDGDTGVFTMLSSGSTSAQEQTQLFDEFSTRMKSLGAGISSIMSAFNPDQLSALEEIELDDLTINMAEGILSLVNLVDFDSMFDGFDSEEEESAYFEEISKRMQDMGTGVNSLMTAFPDVSVIQSLGNIDIEDVSENMAEGIDELFDEMSDIDASDVDLKVVDKFIKITDAMNLVADVGPQMNLTLGGLQSIASQEFVEGMANATNAIHDFALAVQGLSEIEGLSAIEVATNMEGIPKEEQLSSNEFSDFTLPTLDMSQPADSTPIIIETTPITSTQSTQTSGGNVEAKLDTLISLMKSGGIAVNLDGKKVSKGLAQSIEVG